MQEWAFSINHIQGILLSFCLWKLWEDPKCGYDDVSGISSLWWNEILIVGIVLNYIFPNDIHNFLERKQQNLKETTFLLNNSLFQRRNFTENVNITVCLRKFSGSREWLKMGVLFFWVGAWCSSLYLHKPVSFFSEVHTFPAWGMFRVFFEQLCMPQSPWVTDERRACWK